MTVTLQEGMALVLFAVGITACAGGLWIILGREYQRTMRGIASHSNQLHARALTEVGVVPVIDASARLVGAVNQLVRTAMGVGAFLLLIGLALCLVGFWMLSA